MTPRQRIFQALKTGAWLGWQIESNWTDPFLFAVYSLIKPLAATAILVVMYIVVSGNAFSHPLFAYIYLGNAFYMYVGGILQGISWVAIEDREHYRTLKYIYMTPSSFAAYFLGRGMAKVAVTSMAVLITIGVGAWFPGLPIAWHQVDWPAFFLAFVLGIWTLAFLGLALAGVMLLLVHHSWFVGEAIGGALYLFTGAVFPPEVLPAALQPISLLLPVTYWLELLRRYLLGSHMPASALLARWENHALLGILAVMALTSSLLGLMVFRGCEALARRWGMFDRVTHY